MQYMLSRTVCMCIDLGCGYGCGLLTLILCFNMCRQSWHSILGETKRPYVKLICPTAWVKSLSIDALLHPTIFRECKRQAFVSVIYTTFVPQDSHSLFPMQQHNPSYLDLRTYTHTHTHTHIHTHICTHTVLWCLCLWIVVSRCLPGTTNLRNRVCRNQPFLLCARFDIHALNESAPQDEEGIKSAALKGNVFLLSYVPLSCLLWFCRASPKYYIALLVVVFQFGSIKMMINTSGCLVPHSMLWNTHTHTLTLTKLMYT